MTKHFFIILMLGCASGVVLSGDASLAETASMVSERVERPAQSVPGQKQPTYIRTENYPRPPYSGATYYIYERNGEVICTKLQVCNKYDNCDVTYKKGSYKDEIDVETGEPYGKTGAVIIPSNKLRKHVCLTKFKIIQ